MTISPSTREALIAGDLDPDAVVELVRATILEDLDDGEDVTTVATIPADQRATTDLVARATGVVAGVPIAAAAFEVVSEVCGYDPVEVTFRLADGSVVKPGYVVLTVSGSTRALLTGERTALNLLCHLSGIASLTARWVDAIAGTDARIRDTRKTTPGLRALEKYAVRCGGGQNHRMSLSDAALVKDNHIVAAGGVAEAFKAVRDRFPDLPIEIEVDDVDGAQRAIEAGADLILLDNMGPSEMRRAVVMTAGRAKLEASGGLRLDNAAAVAATGVDYLSVGALTHSAAVLDIGSDMRPIESAERKDGEA